MKGLKLRSLRLKAIRIVGLLLKVSKLMSMGEVEQDEKWFFGGITTEQASSAVFLNYFLFF